MCGALAMSWPCASNSAQEKSSRSLMFTELAVLASVTPICSAMAMNRLLKISSNTGSARVEAASRCDGAVFSSSRWSAAAEPGAPAAFDDNGVVPFADHRRALERVARQQRLAREERSVEPAAVEEGAAQRAGLEWPGARGPHARRLVLLRGAPARNERDCIDDDAASGHVKAVADAVLTQELGA